MAFPARCVATFILFTVVTDPGRAQAAPADLATSLCAARSGNGAAAPSLPDSAALLDAARAAETRLDAVRDAPLANADRLLPEASGTADARFSPAAVAAYCAAAGEAMRVAVDGSQAQARDYLLTAFRRAREAGAGGLADLSAYRLALVSINEPEVAGTRGGGRGTAVRAAEGPQRATTTMGTSADNRCAQLERADPALLMPRDLSELALECAAEHSLAGSNSRLAALANLRLSHFYMLAGDEPGRDRDALRRLARERALAALPAAAKIGAPLERAELLSRLAGAAIDLGAVDNPAVADAIGAARNTSGMIAQAAGIADALEARRALGRGDAAAARAPIEKAILAESRTALPARLPGYYLLLAEADPERRLQHVEAAYAALDNLRPLLPRLDPLTEESTFSLIMRDVFAAAAEAQLDAAAGAEEPVRIRRAQEIVEAYRQAELQSAFGSECLPPREPLRTAQLRQREIILYPLLLPDRVELLYVEGKAAHDAAPRYHRLPPDRSANRARVAQLVEQIVLAMSGGGEEADWRPPARALYDLLIGPIADRLGPDSLLAIVPDGPLRALPFAALPAPDGHFLVEQTRLSLIPALAYSQPDGARHGGGLRVVAASIERRMVLPAGTFPALTGTAREAQIAVQYASTGLALPDFTRGALVGALNARRVDVLHLATHAAFNGRSDRAFIVANGDVIRLAELRDLIGNSQARGEALDLIVLSACETAVGDDDVSMGLSGAAVQAGARSVIGSLWQVSDLGTARLMREFYSRYSQGDARSAALRDAQLALLRGGGDNASPTVWAAFTLLGAWR